MGSPDPRAFARSKRGIAGSMIMTTFDRHCLHGFMQDSEFAAKIGSMEASSANPIKQGTQVFPTDSATIRGTIQANTPYDVDQNILQNVGIEVIAGTREIGDAMSVVDTPMFTDQLLPFDSTLMGSNEYGTSATMRVFGLEILNEGSGVSIDDTSNEVQMTYIARFISPWVNQASVTGA